MIMSKKYFTIKVVATDPKTDIILADAQDNFICRSTGKLSESILHGPLFVCFENLKEEYLHKFPFDLQSDCQLKENEMDMSQVIRRSFTAKQKADIEKKSKRAIDRMFKRLGVERSAQKGGQSWKK